jgi:hypothetical protein
MEAEAVPDQPQSSAKPDRVTRWLLIAIGVYSAILVSLLNLVAPIVPLLKKWLAVQFLPGVQ